jgi:hypothetical protein
LAVPPSAFSQSRAEGGAAGGGSARTQHDLETVLSRPHETHGAQRPQRRLVDRARIADDQPEPGGAGIDRPQIRGPAQRRHEGGAARGGRRVRRHHLWRLVLPARRLQAEPADGGPEQRPVEAEIDGAHRDQQQRPRRLAVIEQIVEQPGREAEAELHAEHVHGDHGEPGQHGMRRVEPRRQEHERKLDRLGHAGQERGQRHRQEQAAHRLLP